MKFPLKQDLSDAAKEFIESSLRRSFDVSLLEFFDHAIAVEFGEDIATDEFNKVMKNLLFISRSVDINLLFENNIDSKYTENPQRHLEERGDVIKIADGAYLLQGTFWKVFKGFHAQIMKLAEKYAATEQEYPTLWPVDLFKKINYFSDYPQQVILNTSVKENHAARERFATKYKKEADFDGIDVDEDMTAATYGMPPTVCDCCYYALRNRTVAENKVYTSYNKVFRNERSNIDSLDRMTVFSMREIILVGDSEFVLYMRQRLIDDLCALLKQWGIESKVETANDPFFSNDAIYKNIYQYKHRTKYELLAKLPYSGKYLAIGSINLHQDVFGKTFDIKDREGAHVHSGCIAIGLERLTYAFYCQYGPDERLWPADVAQKLGLGT